MFDVYAISLGTIRCICYIVFGNAWNSKDEKANSGGGTLVWLHLKSVWYYEIIKFPCYKICQY